MPRLVSAISMFLFRCRITRKKLIIHVHDLLKDHPFLLNRFCKLVPPSEVSLAALPYLELYNTCTVFLEGCLFSSIISCGDLKGWSSPLGMSTACPATTLLQRSKHLARSHTWYNDETAFRLSCSRWPMHNQLCLSQAQAWGHERTGPSVLQQGNFPAHKRCSVK